MDGTKRKRRAVVYVHGMGGNADEAEHYKELFPDSEVIGFDYKSQTPREAKEEFALYAKSIKDKYGEAFLIANSIGAYYSMIAGIDVFFEKAYLISPVTDMEKIIYGMMKAANVTEDELKEKGVIRTQGGADLSWEYLSYVRDNPIKWKVPSEILYGSNDELISFETVKEFAACHNARITVMDGGEHWFHTDEQMRFLDDWLRNLNKKENVVMNKYIAYCGLNCETCEARIATANNDDALRVKVAKLWSELNSADITPEMINCDGCRMDGVKTPFCDSICAIRKCAVLKKVQTCGECPEMKICGKLAMITGNNEEALKRLLSAGK
jgi:hypothetical protein